MALEASVSPAKARNHARRILGLFRTKVDAKTFAYMLVFQGLYYLIISTNILFLSRGKVLETMISDAVGGLVNFGLIQHVASAKGRWATAGYVIGGAIGSGLSIPIMKWIFQ